MLGGMLRQKQIDWGMVLLSSGEKKTCMCCACLPGGPGSVRLRFVYGMVRPVPVLVLTVPLWKGFCLYLSTVSTERDSPVSVAEKWFERFWFLFRFLEKRFRRFRSPVRFLGHPAVLESYYDFWFFWVFPCEDCTGNVQVYTSTQWNPITVARIRLQPVLLSWLSSLGSTCLTVRSGSSLCTQSTVEMVRLQGRSLS